MHWSLPEKRQRMWISSDRCRDDSGGGPVLGGTGGGGDPRAISGS